MNTENRKLNNSAHAGTFFVRKWYRTVRTYIGNLRDSNISYLTEEEARAAFAAPYEKGQTEAVLYRWKDDGSAYYQVARSKRAKK
jgi:hypothetical protein